MKHRSRPVVAVAATIAVTLLIAVALLLTPAPAAAQQQTLTAIAVYFASAATVHCTPAGCTVDDDDQNIPGPGCAAGSPGDNTSTEDADVPDDCIFESQKRAQKKTGAVKIKLRFR